MTLSLIIIYIHAGFVQVLMIEANVQPIEYNFLNFNPLWDSYRKQPLLLYLLQSHSKGPANFILYETCNCSLENFNWPYSMQTNLTIENRSFNYKAD